jgi:hypothetical protein
MGNTCGGNTAGCCCCGGKNEAMPLTGLKDVEENLENLGESPENALKDRGQNEYTESGYT